MLSKGLYYAHPTAQPLPINVVVDMHGNCIYFNDAQEALHQWNFADLILDDARLKRGITHEYIVLQDSGFVAKFQQIIRKQQTHSPKRLPGWSTFAGVIVVFVAALVGLYFFLLPYAAQQALRFIPLNYDKKIGNAYEQQFFETNTIDTAATRLLNDFATAIPLKGHQQTHFVAVQSPIVNAFAMPNGTIVVYKGILQQLNSYEELAALMGHEHAHVQRRHSMKLLCQNLSAYLLVAALLGDIDGTVAAVADNMNELQSLSNSREAEDEADADGFAMLTCNQIDPKGMIQLFKHLQNASKNEPQVPEFLSTHPITDNRIEHVERLIKNKKKNFVVTSSKTLNQLFKSIKASL